MPGVGGFIIFVGWACLVWAPGANLGVIAQDRTYVVVSTSVTATGQMVSDTTTLFPRADELRSRIEWSGSRPENIFVDAREVTATADLSEDQYDNIFLLGMAVQAGLLPLSPADIEWALDLNGVQVDRKDR